MFVIAAGIAGVVSLVALCFGCYYYGKAEGIMYTMDAYMPHLDEIREDHMLMAKAYGTLWDETCDAHRELDSYRELIRTLH